MPLQDEKGDHYIKLYRVEIDSVDRRENSRGVYDYVIDLPNEIQYVTGVELTSYNIPRDTCPTFLPASSGVTGTNKLDFNLSTAGTTTGFTITLPSRKYAYKHVQVPSLSYVDRLQQMLNDAIANDPDFGTGQANEATFVVSSTPDEKTSVTVSGTGLTGFQFLFSSGANSSSSPHTEMGFTNADTASALSTVSPSAVQLEPFRYVDISLGEVEEVTPLSRVFVQDNLNTNVLANEPNATRPRLITSHPISKLNRLHVQLTLRGGLRPATGPEHNLVFTVFSVANEPTAIPKWTKQVFSL